MRVLALALSRLRGALPARVLLAPVVLLVAVQLIGLSGAPQPAPVLLVTSACFALPALAWLARQVLDAEPDDQVLLSQLAVGGAVRETAAGLLAAYGLCGPLAAGCAWAALLRVDADGVPARVLTDGTALALLTALAAVGVGALATRALAGRGAGPVVVLVTAPVLVAVLSISRDPLVTALVPRLGTAVRLTQDPAPGVTAADSFVAGAGPVLLQVLAWSAAVLGLRLLVARRPGRR